METPAPEDAVAAAILHWSSLAELARFAVDRHGFGDDNGGFGVIYPDDLDEYARVVERVEIPEGFVQVYGFWGPPEGYEILVPEADYLRWLAAALRDAGHPKEAAQVSAIMS
jgi:hypothetical protein